MRSNKTVYYYISHISKLPQLTSKERFVLVRRLRKITLEKIGKKLGVSEGRVRQIEKSAISKIKNKIYQQALFKKIAEL